MTLLLWVLGAAAFLLIAGLSFELLGAAADRRRYPPPGRLVDVNGSRIHTYSEGKGSPAVVLESGFAASCLNWRTVQRELSKYSRVISYDRAGLGWSPTAPTPRTIANLASELEAVLEALEVNGPIILVAHSFGSLIVREYCHRHPDRVAGMVLVEPIDCEHWRTPPLEYEQRVELGVKLSRRGVWLARFGVVRFSLFLLSIGAWALPKRIARAASGKGETVISRMTKEVSKMPREVWPAIRAHWSRPQGFQTLADYLSLLTSCVNELPYLPFGDLPLIVITAENARESQQREHRILVKLSTRGEHIFAEKSGHWVHLDRPELVVSCVQKLLQETRVTARSEEHFHR